MNELYTPSELAQMKAQLEQMYTNNNMQNQNFNTVASMTKNVSPLGNLGILLGTLGGKWAAQRYNDNQFENFLKAYDRYNLNQELEKNNIFDKAANWVGNNQLNQNLPTFAETKNQFVNNFPTPSNQYNFSKPDLSLFGNDFDWRNQNYFSNVKRPSYLSVS